MTSEGPSRSPAKVRDRQSAADYERVVRAIAFIAERVGEQPELATVAEHLSLSPYHFQRLFSRWAGTSPKRFLQVLTVERAKSLLQDSAPLLAVAGELGLSSSSRLHDHFVQLEAMTPGEHRARGAGLTIAYGCHATPFGKILLGVTPRGICRLDFIEAENEGSAAQRLGALWPQAELRESPGVTAPLVERLFGGPADTAPPCPLHVRGTNFQLQVWRALLRIPSGALASYRQVAAAIGRPTAARAVASAVAANPVAFLIPCHRVIRESGELGGYRWGLARKQAIHCWEAEREAEREAARKS